MVLANIPYATGFYSHVRVCHRLSDTFTKIHDRSGSVTSFTHETQENSHEMNGETEDLIDLISVEETLKVKVNFTRKVLSQELRALFYPHFVYKPH